MPEEAGWAGMQGSGWARGGERVIPEPRVGAERMPRSAQPTGATGLICGMLVAWRPSETLVRQTGLERSKVTDKKFRRKIHPLTEHRGAFSWGRTQTAHSESPWL